MICACARVCVGDSMKGPIACLNGFDCGEAQFIIQI